MKFLGIYSKLIRFELNEPLWKFQWDNFTTEQNGRRYWIPLILVCGRGI